jgi:hypothetical protein
MPLRKSLTLVMEKAVWDGNKQLSYELSAVNVKNKNFLKIY